MRYFDKCSDHVSWASFQTSSYICSFPLSPSPSLSTLCSVYADCAETVMINENINIIYKIKNKPMTSYSGHSDLRVISSK